MTVNPKWATYDLLENQGSTFALRNGATAWYQGLGDGSDGLRIERTFNAKRLWWSVHVTVVPLSQPQFVRLRVYKNGLSNVIYQTSLSLATVGWRQGDDVHDETLIPGDFIIVEVALPGPPNQTVENIAPHLEGYYV